MHSFFEISKFLDDAPFVLTTVDTIFDEREFADYVRCFRQEQKAALMGVTDYIDDERPLYVETDRQQNVIAFHDHADHCRYISAGIYGLQPTAVFSLNNCIARSEKRMRNFQRALIADGYPVKAYPFSQVFDIDHATDISKAAAFLR